MEEERVEGRLSGIDMRKVGNWALYKTTERGARGYIREADVVMSQIMTSIPKYAVVIVSQRNVSNSRYWTRRNAALSQSLLWS
jgi:hypothetical protein